MNEEEQLKREHAYWHQDYESWQQEIACWQHETQRLVALLYKLERTLPEHFNKFDQHVTCMCQREKELARYECDMDEHCLAERSSHSSLKEQATSHQHLAKLHDDVSREHQRFKIEYDKIMARFRQLVVELHNEIDR